MVYNFNVFNLLANTGVCFYHTCMFLYPDSKVNGTNMRPTSVLSAPAGSHVCPMNSAIRVPRIRTSSSLSPNPRMVSSRDTQWCVIEKIHSIFPAEKHECLGIFSTIEVKKSLSVWCTTSANRKLPMHSAKHNHLKPTVYFWLRFIHACSNFNDG